MADAARSLVRDRQVPKRFAVVHNIPSPYRLHMFSLLNERLRARGVEFHVHFMARSHRHRHHWSGFSEGIPFPHTFWLNTGPIVRGRKWDFNPGLIAALSGRRTDYLMLGGLWDSLTNFALTILGRRSVGIAWCEGNTSTPGRITGAALTLKRSLLQRLQFCAVPGIEGGKYMQLLLGNASPAPKIVVLPNIVDETLFTPEGRDVEGERRQVRSTLNVAAGDSLALWPARLIPDKGVCEFLSCFDRGDFRGWTIAILGEGPLKGEISRILSERNLQERVRLIPYLPYEKMPSLYRAADLFLLPSMLDPNPLSVVEAMHAGLPILVSKRIGNFPEALRPGENGWGVDPLDEAGLRSAVIGVFSTPRSELRRMGTASREVAASVWEAQGRSMPFLTGS